MKTLRLLLSVVVAAYMTGAGQVVSMAQETRASITLSPLQYADVKGNVGKFEELNWMKNGADAGFSDISFIKQINKNISLDIQGSEFPKSDTGDGHLVLKDGDIGFLKIDYNAFRKYYANTGGVYPYGVAGINGYIPAQYQGAQLNAPDLQMDVSFFKLETGLGEISDPLFDVSYEHNSKDGNKSLEQWASAYFLSNGTYSGSRKIAPSWQDVHDTSDVINVTEKKEIAGVTFKGQQNAEIDYSHHVTYMQNLGNSTGVFGTGGVLSTGALTTNDESPDAKLFGAGLRAEKWMLNDKTYTSLGYHYNHTGSSDYMQNMNYYPTSVAGVITLVPQASGATQWNHSSASEDEHVWVGNFNTSLTPNLTFIADGKYEHVGEEGYSIYRPDASLSVASQYDIADMKNRQDNAGEHVELRYSGIAHTSLYAQSDMEQNRNWVYQYFDNANAVILPSGGNFFYMDRLCRTQKASWAVGGEVVPNRFFIFKSQVQQRWEDNNYDTLYEKGNQQNLTFLDALSINGIEEASTLTWKPYHWLQNSLKYQFVDTQYGPKASTEGNPVSESPAPANYAVAKNKVLSSVYTYEISVQPIDPLLLMLTYSHVENYVRTVGDSGTFTASGQLSSGAQSLIPPYIPKFNSGDNSFLFSSSYSPLESLTWNNSVSYTISDNYVDFNTGLPLGSNFRELNFTTGIDYTFHKWLKIGPKYEHASYRDNSLAGAGNYSANIFMFDAKFSW